MLGLRLNSCGGSDNVVAVSSLCLEAILLADFTPVEILQHLGRVAVALDGGNSAAVATEAFMDKIARDGPVMDKAVDVLLEVTGRGVSSVYDLSFFIDQNNMGNSVSLVIENSIALVTGHMVVLAVQPVLFSQEFLSSFFALVQVKPDNLNLVLPEIFV